MEQINGSITFEYDKELISVAGSAGNDYHEFKIYKYIDGKLTLIEKLLILEVIEKYIDLKMVN